MAGKQGGIAHSKVSKPDGPLPLGPNRAGGGSRAGTIATGRSPWTSAPLAPTRGSVVHFPTDRPNRQKTKAPRAMGSNV